MSRGDWHKMAAGSRRKWDSAHQIPPALLLPFATAVCFWVSYWQPMSVAKQEAVFDGYQVQQIAIANAKKHLFDANGKRKVFPRYESTPIGAAALRAPLP